MSLWTGIAADWPALSPLLDEALELAPGQRTAWLDNLPPEHRQFKTSLRALLAGSANLPPQIIGSWRLIQKIGEGGMAEVWLAERSDGLLARPAALKLPRNGWANALFCHRLARERDILDALHHPNIARLLDAGLTESGQPFLVIDYVAGQRIDHYCRDHKLSVRARLELFLQVTSAIAFAHHSLVLHRDLKPSNILVTEEGAVRVLDFGIAKLLEFDHTEETDLTLYTGRALTPDYASPEQIAGEPLTVSSDVYSLGVILYELLTGVCPYRLKRKSIIGLEEQILEIEPTLPSKAVAAKDLRRALRGDLDSIVMMALRKRPQIRYLSVESFADDIQRYLRRRPVLAQPDRRFYRASLFVKRHKLALANAALLLLILIAASALTIWQAHAAFVQKRQAEEAKALLISMLFDAHSYRGIGKPASALDMLRQVEQRFVDSPMSDTKSRVQVLNILGASLLSQEAMADGESTIRRATREAIDLPPSDPERLRSRLLMNWILLSRGQTSETRIEIDRLLEDMSHFDSAFPEDVAGAWRIRSAVALADRDSAKAIETALAALRVAESRLGVHHNQSVLALIDLAYGYSSAGNQELALKTAERAIERGLETYSNKETHPNVLKARIAFAHGLARSGQPAQAVRMAEDAIRNESSLFGPSTTQVGLSLMELAEMQKLAGQLVAARQSIERAYSILTRQFRADSPAYASLLKLRSEIDGRAPAEQAAPYLVDK